MSTDGTPAASGVDPAMVRRAARAVAWQTAAAVAVTIVVVSLLAFSLTIRSEDVAQEHLVRRAAVAASLADPPSGVVLVRGVPGRPAELSRNAPDEVRRLDPFAVPAGGSNLIRSGHDFESYAVDTAGGTRTVALLDVTPRAEAGRRLVTSLAGAAVVGMLAAGLVGVVVGRRAVRPLGQALALQRRFVADASHELRTPLAVLHTRAQLLQRRLDRPGAADRLDGLDRLRSEAAQLVTDSRALGDVVEDLLLSADLAHRPGTGQPVDLGALADELVTSVRPHASTLRVDLRAEVDHAELLVVSGIRSSLRRAMAALVDNALAHEQPGGTVTVQVHRAGPAVELAVIDDGEGLDADQADRLMHRHVRGSGTGDDRGRVGLGLALVREVLAAHRGTLGVVSRPGEGATFTMTIPAADS